MFKKCLIFLIIFAFCLVGVQTGFAEEQSDCVLITVLDGNQIVFQNKYTKNPKFFDNAKGKEYFLAKAFGENFGDKEFCDYALGGFGLEITDFLNKTDSVSPNDCISFNKKDFSFSYRADKSSWEVDRKVFFDELYSKLSCEHLIIKLEKRKREPLYFESELKEYTQKIGEYQTEYANSTSSRKKNIYLASNKISGIMIKSGEIFSFNNVVGKRTVENGFQVAKVILNGEYVEGVGGGVCQVATTLYNGLLRAGFSPVSCARHTLAPSYVPLSFDAMVSEQVDLKMRNDTGAPVYIGMIADGKKLKAVIFGKSGAESYRFESEIVETLIHENAETDTESSYKNGYKSKGYKLVYKNGVLVKKILLRTDFYKPYKVKI